MLCRSRPGRETPSPSQSKEKIHKECVLVWYHSVYNCWRGSILTHRWLECQLDRHFSNWKSRSSLYVFARDCYPASRTLFRTCFEDDRASLGFHACGRCFLFCWKIKWCLEDRALIALEHLWRHSHRGEHAASIHECKNLVHKTSIWRFPSSLCRRPRKCFWFDQLPSQW